MVTGDNIQTAKAIAAECGIITEDGTAIEGKDFRVMSVEEQYALIPTLDVRFLMFAVFVFVSPTNSKSWETCKTSFFCCDIIDQIVMSPLYVNFVSLTFLQLNKLQKIILLFFSSR